MRHPNFCRRHKPESLVPRFSFAVNRSKSNRKQINTVFRKFLIVPELPLPLPARGCQKLVPTPRTFLLYHQQVALDFKHNCRNLSSWKPGIDPITCNERHKTPRHLLDKHVITDTYLTMTKHLGTLIYGPPQRTIRRALELISGTQLSFVDAQAVGWDVVNEVTKTSRSSGRELVIGSTVVAPEYVLHNIGRVEDLRDATDSST
jgi:hypothetical protein